MVALPRDRGGTGRVREYPLGDGTERQELRPPGGRAHPEGRTQAVRDTVLALSRRTGLHRQDRRVGPQVGPDGGGDRRVLAEVFRYQAVTPNSQVAIELEVARLAGPMLSPDEWFGFTAIRES